YYEIQILRLFNTDRNYAVIQQEIAAKVNWANALRVETQACLPSVRLTIAEGTGFYLWRVRPIGTYFPGGIANAENYGGWSAASANGDVVTLNKNALSLPESFYFIDPDEDLNWIYNRVFTEGDPSVSGTRVSEGISYADHLLNLRQSQVYNSAQDSMLMTQTVLDFSGRSSLTTLPVPVQADLDDGYRENFVQNNAGALYTAKDFDEDGKLKDPEMVKSAGTDFSYYSDANAANPTVPDAEGYAFKRTLFKTDGTNRVTEESGVGKVHALGEQTDGRGRTTRVLFGSPSDDELIRLFGDEAPLAEKVAKTITIDPNNVASVTYTSVTDGNVIATALASVSTPNLEALDATAAPVTVENLIDHNYLQHNKIVSYKRLALPVPTQVTLAYEPDCTTAGWGCIDADCKQGVQFFISDLTRGKIYHSQTFETCNLSNPFDLSGVNWLEEDNATIAYIGTVLPLPEGEYLFVKCVFSDLPDDFTSNAIGEENEAEQALVNAIATLMDGVNNADGYDDFEAQMTDLQTSFEKFNDPLTPQAEKDLEEVAIVSLLGLPAGFQLPAGFVFQYNPNGTGNDPASMTIGAACCGNATFSVPKPEKCIPCEMINALKPSYPKSQEDALFNEVYEIVRDSFLPILGNRWMEIYKLTTWDWSGAAEQDTLAKYAPGFTKESLQFMLTEMLVSRYYTGNSKYDDATLKWYKAIHDTNGELVYAYEDADGKLQPTNNNVLGEAVESVTKFNYDDCKQLYNCWKQAVAMLNAFEFEDELNIMDEFNERQGNKSSEDHYDDEESKGGHKIFGAILDFIISQKMRKFNNSNDGKLTKERMTALVNLPNLFMECAGYQFAGILDKKSAIPADYNDYFEKVTNPTMPLKSNVHNAIADNLDGNTSEFFDDHIAPAAIPHYYSQAIVKEDDPSTVLDPAKLVYPYILRPEWMFKYFVYNVARDDPPYLHDVISPLDDGFDY
ncbi:MAG: hypothetical protein AAB316_17040, partial [Bacteroidota bacterium]